MCIHVLTIDSFIICNSPVISKIYFSIYKYKLLYMLLYVISFYNLHIFNLFFNSASFNEQSTFYNFHMSINLLYL